MNSFIPTFVIPVYNESTTIEDSVQRIYKFYKNDTKVVLVENGSTDNSWNICEELQRKYLERVYSLRSPNKGLGFALSMGFAWVLENQFYNPNGYIGFVGAELPFDLSDAVEINKVLSEIDEKSAIDIFVGSKGHSASLLEVTILRKFISLCFFLVRKIYLGMRCRDPQGTVYVRPDVLQKALPMIRSRDYFYTTELIYWAELNSKKILEVPITMLPQTRPSSVSLLKDPLKGLFRTFKLKKSKKILKHKVEQ